MGQHSCKDYGGVVSLMVFLLTVTNGEYVDNDGLMCYKPPPPATNESDHGLFEFAVSVKTPESSIIGIAVNAQVISQTLRIRHTEQCSVSGHIVVNISVPIVPLSLDCKYNKPVQTPIPIWHSVHITDEYLSSGTSLIEGMVDFNDIVASDDDLNGTCQVTLPISTGILKGLPNITLDFDLKILGCPHGMYGLYCVQQCTCFEGVECHPFTGACICPKGLQGKICNSATPMVVTERTTVFVPFGERVDLICVVYGMYNPIMQWKKGESYRTTKIIHANTPYSPSPIHMITKVEATTAAVNGVYTCRVENAGVVYQSDVNLIVTDIPQPFLEGPVNETIVFKQGTMFRCRTKPQAGALAWMNGNHKVLSRNTSTGPYIVEQGPDDVSLIFDEVRFEDAGMYRCIVGHNGANDSVSLDVWLVVQSQGKKPFIATSFQSGLQNDTLRLSEDEEVVLVCEVDKVYPEPVISWLLGNESLTTNAKVTYDYSDDGVSFIVRSLLTLKPTWDDNGKALVCVSKVPDFNEDHSRVVDLDISYAPKVTVHPKGETFQPGTSPSFKCSAFANPSSNMTYTWLLSEQNNTIMKHFNGDSVRIHDLKPHHNKASLTCMVSNDIGVNSDRAVIRVFGGSNPNTVILHYTVMVVALAAVIILIVVILIIIFRHRTKINKLFFNRHKLAGDKLHDIFVAYKGGGEEEDFIRLSLIPKLEEWGCDVCIHYKNFKPGAEITDNIQTAVSTSRKTILVLSPDFMESEWCYYEFLCAMDEMLRDQTDIIPLMYQDIQHLELCDSMQHLLQTVSYVPWLGGDGAQGQTERFWKPLKRAVETHLNVNRVIGADGINDDGCVLNDHDEIELIP
ncbi:uncharacterized protein LOC117303520 [Asterias rubens]|uniref:uncharacterized protein LOC117303520 n=1 Tax=Asterias rubens TaxID=7604 RepID=UPI001455B332|nr:uncharacterized protein LOC117303520 [Asterias rubens]